MKNITITYAFLLQNNRKLWQGLKRFKWNLLINFTWFSKWFSDVWSEKWNKIEIMGCTLWLFSCILKHRIQDSICVTLHAECSLVIFMINDTFQLISIGLGFFAALAQSNFYFPSKLIHKTKKSGRKSFVQWKFNWNVSSDKFSTLFTFHSTIKVKIIMISKIFLFVKKSRNHA